MTPPPEPGTSDHRQLPKSWPRRHKILTAVGAIAAIFAVGSIASAVSAHGSGGTEGNNTSGSGKPSASSAATSTAMTAPRSAASSRPQTALKVRFPPKTLAEFRAFAATGDAGQVRQVAASNEGLPSCPEPNIYVTVSRRLAVRTLQADLSAFFLQRGLINYCGSAVFAFHSRRDYRAHIDNGYTAGSVILTMKTGSGPKRNLEVNIGDVYKFPVRFGFNF